MHKHPRPGWVYILTNPSMPGLVKVGFTTRDPTTRAAELTAAAGVPTPFTIAWCRAVADCAAVESTVHRMLDDRRVSGRREFFRCDLTTARQVVEAAAGAQLGRAYRPPRAQPRKRSRKRRRSDRAAMLGLVLLALLVLLMVFKPPVPGWLPSPVYQVVRVIERWG